jgi:Na+-translocating ferredoxin:NAD+ oxidoreductase subunit B
MGDVYQQLRERLDQIGSGYPATDTGVEIRILKKLFSPEDAQMFLQMTPMLESPAAVSQRIGQDEAAVAGHLEDMASRGLLFRHRKGDLARYSAIPFVVGIFEFQLNTVDRELAEDLEEYFEKGLGVSFQSTGTPVMRSIPINTDIVMEHPVASYEDAMAIVDSQKVIAIAPCICRTMAQKVDRDCGKPLEACFIFGSHGAYYVDNGMGRYIDKEEAKRIIRGNEAAGLVMQPFNSQQVGGMCSCCGDCCGMLRSLKMQKSPADAVKSNYYAAIDGDLCTGCEICLDRCQMDAIEMVDDTAVVSLKRCIGCGLCVTTCATEAVKLIRKAAGSIYEPPANGMETYMKIAQARGKM